MNCTACVIFKCHTCTRWIQFSCKQSQYSHFLPNTNMNTNTYIKCTHERTHAYTESQILRCTKSHATHFSYLFKLQTVPEINNNITCNNNLLACEYSGGGDGGISEVLCNGAPPTVEWNCIALIFKLNQNVIIINCRLVM